MLASGVGQSKAWLMYRAVESFGPKWDPPKYDKRCDGPNFDFENCAIAAKRPMKRIPKLNADELRKFTDELGTNIDPEDLQKLKSAIEGLH
jgi:hypothetical protein